MPGQGIKRRRSPTPEKDEDQHDTTKVIKITASNITLSEESLLCMADKDEIMSVGEPDPELEAIKARVKEMEEEAERLKEMQKEVDQEMRRRAPTSSPAFFSSEKSSVSVFFSGIEEKAEADGRSIYVGNVDYGANAGELEQHFQGCGAVQRVTIMCNKFDGSPMGFAYIEFLDKEAVGVALALDESLFRGRQIKVRRASGSGS